MMGGGPGMIPNINNGPSMSGPQGASSGRGGPGGPGGPSGMMGS